MRCGGIPETRGSRPFRFEAVWLTHPDYATVVEKAWDKEKGNLVEALSKVKDDSIVFNQEVFGNIFRRKQALERRLKGIQKSLERVDSARLTMLENQLQKEYDTILFQEELIWYQKSMEKWVQLRDKISKFFHAQTIIRHRRNKILGFKLASGEWCTDDLTLQEEAQNFFQNLFYSSEVYQNSDFKVRNIPKLDEDGISSLTQPISREEVMFALNSMHPYKAPEPDGFQGIFFKQFWHVVGEDIFSLISQAFQMGFFDPSLIETLIAIIPKVDSPQSIKEFMQHPFS